MERMVNGKFSNESFEEYAEHSLTHDDVEPRLRSADEVVREFPWRLPREGNRAIYDRLGLVVGE